MKIICGTDLSDNSRQSIAAANALATRFDQDLDVVHVIHPSISDKFAQAVRDMHTKDATDGLNEIEAMLDRRDDRARTQLLWGHADEELNKLAADSEVSFAIVGSLGHRTNDRWALGSTAERVAETCHKPTLVVRDEKPFTEWSAERPLRIFIAWNFEETSENALRWIAEWRKFGPCEFTVAHVDFPPEEARRLGVKSNFWSAHNEPLVQDVLERDVRERAAAILGEPPEHVVVEGDYGRPDFHFSHLANERRPDLVVCGTHQRHGIGRLAHTSFSRGLLYNSRASVLTVPLAGHVAEPIPEIRKVLVTTDFSDLGNHAIPTAYAMVKDGGTVYLLHIEEPFHVPSPMIPKYQTTGVSASEHDRDNRDMKMRLQHLIPPAAEARGIKTDVRIVEGTNLAAAICQCAERYGVDMICMGSHGRGGLTQLVTGSVTNAVISRSHRPVTVVKPPES